MKLTEKECRMIWRLCNIAQNSQLDRFKQQMDILTKYMPSEQVIKWQDETVEDFEMLQIIKTKMVVLELTADTDTNVVEKVEK